MAPAQQLGFGPGVVFGDAALVKVNHYNPHFARFHLSTSLDISRSVLSAHAASLWENLSAHAATVP